VSLANEEEIIIGQHSIVEALNNPLRTPIALIGEADKISEIRNKLTKEAWQRIQPFVRTLDSHQVQEYAKSDYRRLDYEYSRIASNIYLLCARREDHEMDWLYEGIACGELSKILVLDQVTDLHNRAAIVRTAAFFNVNVVIFSQKGELELSPAFYRISSGAAEHIPIMNVSSLPRFLTKAKELGALVFGLAEGGEAETPPISGKPLCVVLGAEDVGISNAVMRCLDAKVMLESDGPIKTLNVSVAAALAMNRFFHIS
jgi:23S rRNA (guanosine2251-2'-O)-methyltransferase